MRSPGPLPGRSKWRCTNGRARCSCNCPANYLTGLTLEPRTRIVVACPSAGTRARSCGDGRGGGHAATRETPVADRGQGLAVVIALRRAARAGRRAGAPIHHLADRTRRDARRPPAVHERDSLGCAIGCGSGSGAGRATGLDLSLWQASRAGRQHHPGRRACRRIRRRAQDDTGRSRRRRRVPAQAACGIGRRSPGQSAGTPRSRMAGRAPGGAPAHGRPARRRGR